jgi:hypothetical protein
VAERADELYVGHAAGVPPGVVRAVRGAVLALACAAIAVALCLVLGQGEFAPAAFELGTTRAFRGVVQEHPVPALVVRRPGSATMEDAATSSFLLVAPWKRGAEALVRGRHGLSVELTGTLLYREGETMIEVDPDSIVEVPIGDAASGVPPIVDLGEVELDGEIVDSKCHLGAMRPGEGKTHRDCAVRCISGGIPPALRVRDAAGATQLWLLVGAAGEPIHRAVLPYVAEPVRIAGRGERRGDLYVLYAEPSAIRRLGQGG